jgi:S-DNA-T family DNA segregation ATPase FtsK/SpoIIIE
VPSLLLGVGGGAALAVTGQRTKLRRELEDKVLEALAPLLGVRHLDRRIVKMTKWTNRWPGLPAKVRIHYAPGAPDSDPMWKSEILAVLDSRLLARYEVARHEPRRCTLWLTLVTKEQTEDKEPPYSQVRAERAITELIGPTAKVTGVELDGEELRSLTVTHQAGAKLAASGYRNRIERVISTMMPGRWRAVWDLEGDEVRFEVRPSLPSSVWLPPRAPEDTEDLLRNYRQVKIPCAIDEDGREILWYPARVPQAMLTGGTGTGKTSTAHALLGQITQYGWPVWVLDAKRVEFLDFRTWPNVQIVAGSIPQQVALIRRVWELMEYRYQLIEEGKATVNDFEPLVVFLDEFAEFRSNLFEWYAQIKVKGDPTKPPTLAEVASLARKARTARIHLVLSTQRPDAEFLGGEMRDNFGFRISMGRLSPQGAMMMWENPAVGVSLPRARTGRATATHEDGKPVEVQCYRFPDINAEEGSEETAAARGDPPSRSALAPAGHRAPRGCWSTSTAASRPHRPSATTPAPSGTWPRTDPTSTRSPAPRRRRSRRPRALLNHGLAGDQHHRPPGPCARPHLRLVDALEQARPRTSSSTAARPGSSTSTSATRPRSAAPPATWSSVTSSRSRTAQGSGSSSTSHPRKTSQPLA